MANDPELRRGVYDSDYFSGAQVAIYIGDVWVDEVTSLTFQLQEPRVPLYGYADTTFRDICRGQVIVTGSFSVNFKEAGYLWLILNRYKKMFAGKATKALLTPMQTVNGATEQEIQIAKAFNIEERYIQNKLNAQKKGSTNKALQALAAQRAALISQKTLTGYASSARGLGGGEQMSGAESVFEAFENVVWGRRRSTDFNTEIRRVTDIRLNPFDIYITYGDYTGDDRLHHTMQKLDTVYLTSAGKQIVIDGTPIQEEYSFIARDLV